MEDAAPEMEEVEIEFNRDGVLAVELQLSRSALFAIRTGYDLPVNEAGGPVDHELCEGGQDRAPPFAPTASSGDPDCVRCVEDHQYIPTAWAVTAAGAIRAEIVKVEGPTRAMDVHIGDLTRNCSTTNT
eukprot:7334464-Prymnesium_polylepis.1